MASYQIPQFLDSGDKIIANLNMRQFGYALGGLLVSTLIFTTTQSLLPGIGNYAVIPVFPVAALAAYLALGKYNGRDSEVYVLKFILFNSKPKSMTYTRVPDVSDLNRKLTELKPDLIKKKWDDRVKEQNAIEENEFLSFEKLEDERKAQLIREIGQTIDLSKANTMAKVYNRQTEAERKERLIQELQEKQRLQRQKGRRRR